MNRESLSALLDGECQGPELDRLLDALEREPALKNEWNRLCLARESRTTSVRSTHPDFSAGVMAAIAAETPAPRATVIAFPQRVWRITQPLVGYALAASLGAFAVFGLMAPRDDAGSEFVEAPVQVASYATTAPVTTTAQDTPLDAYLLDYSHSRARQGMGGSLGYARVAAHNAVYRREATGE